jgi:hypothetical protein
MKLLTTYSCGDHLNLSDQIDREMVPVVIMAHGETTDDLVPALSDDVAATLAMDDIKDITIEDDEGNSIEPNVGAVCEAIANGATTIMVKQIYIADGSTRTDVYTINDLDI